jgi:hypothetical protein
MSDWLQRHFGWPLVVGLIAQYVGWATVLGIALGQSAAITLPLALLLLLGSSGLTVAMCYFWAKRGGYHGALAWFGLLNFVGLIVLAALFRNTAATRAVQGFPVLPAGAPLDSKAPPEGGRA